jgi:hypothetical protein
LVRGLVDGWFDGWWGLNEGARDFEVEGDGPQEFVAVVVLNIGDFELVNALREFSFGFKDDFGTTGEAGKNGNGLNGPIFGRRSWRLGRIEDIGHTITDTELRVVEVTAVVQREQFQFVETASIVVGNGCAGTVES